LQQQQQTIFLNPSTDTVPLWKEILRFYVFVFVLLFPEWISPISISVFTLYYWFRSCLL